MMDDKFDTVMVTIGLLAAAAMIALAMAAGPPDQPPVMKDGKVFCSDGYRLERNWREFIVCRKDDVPNGTMIPHEMESNPAHEV